MRKTILSDYVELRGLMFVWKHVLTWQIGCGCIYKELLPTSEAVHTSSSSMYTGSLLLALAALLVLGEAARPLRKVEALNRRSHFYKSKFHKKQLETGKHTHF